MSQTIQFPATDDAVALSRRMRHELKTIHAVYRELHRCLFELKRDTGNAEQLSVLALGKLNGLIQSLEHCGASQNHRAETAPHKTA